MGNDMEPPPAWGPDGRPDETTRRIIPCLDVRDGRVVKGVQFEGLRDVGDPPELAGRYEAEGADELVFLDVTATLESRGIFLDVVQRTAERLFIPLTVGGGIRTVEDVRRVLRCGADKVSVNTAALERPEILREGAERFGSQCMVVAIDARRRPQGGWEVHSHSGRRPTGREAVAWAVEAERFGAGEILLTSIDADGVQQGYDLDLLRAVAGAVSIPVIASGGCGSVEHILEVFRSTPADAALAASIFHSRRARVREVKQALAALGISVRPGVPA